jgi:hypothetical protein
MTEAEWRNSDQPEPLLAFLRGKATDRKLRLYAVACCRLIGELLTDERSRAVVEASERFADGLASRQELDTAEGRAWAAVEAAQPLLTRELTVAYGIAGTTGKVWSWAARAAAEAASPDAGQAVSATASAVERAAIEWAMELQDPKAVARVAGAAVRTDLVRDLFGNPFRPVAFDPFWRSPAVVGLASSIYEEHTFDQLPLLADALTDAGCADDELLVHCRSAGTHARGCWAVDLALGKSG